jgi:transportin-1
MALTFYKGNSLLTLYDTIIILTENFESEFTNLEAVQQLIENILKKWYELLNLSSEELYTNQVNMTVFDITCSIIKVSGPLIKDFFNDFISGSMRMIDKNFNDKEITSKCLEIISSLCQGLPDLVRASNEKFRIVNTIFKLHEQYNHDTYLKQYLLPLIGDICMVDPKLLESNIDFFINILINDLDVPEVSKKMKLDMEKISVCNNSCWTLGLLSQSFPEKVTLKANDIMKKIIKIYSFPKLNKSLAQNISICIGRMAMICADVIANYLELFIKQFCLSLKSAPHSEEKEEAFK